MQRERVVGECGIWGADPRASLLVELARSRCTDPHVSDAVHNLFHAPSARGHLGQAWC